MLLSQSFILSGMIIHYIAGENIFFHYCLHAFSTEEISKSHNKDCFKINNKQRVIVLKIDEFVKLKSFERKIKSPFIIYANSESI